MRRATGSELSKFLHAVFDDEYGRPPSSSELNYYANSFRTFGPLETSPNERTLIRQDLEALLQGKLRGDAKR